MHNMSTPFPFSVHSFICKPLSYCFLFHAEHLSHKDSNVRRHMSMVECRIPFKSHYTNPNSIVRCSPPKHPYLTEHYEYRFKRSSSVPASMSRLQHQITTASKSPPTSTFPRAATKPTRPALHRESKASSRRLKQENYTPTASPRIPQDQPFNIEASPLLSLVSIVQLLFNYM